MNNLHPIEANLISRSEKEDKLNQKGAVIWLTGLSGSGKSTIAISLERRLFNEGRLVKVLDGDNIRTGINKDLSFSLEDREENIRRIAEVSKLFSQSACICINSFVSPTQAIRNKAKTIIGEHDFIEVFVNASLELCESRDVKGLYKKARAGEIKGFTGIDSPYEIPRNPDIELNTGDYSVKDCVDQLHQFLRDEGIINN